MMAGINYQRNFGGKAVVQVNGKLRNDGGEQLRGALGKPVLLGIKVDVDISSLYDLPVQTLILHFILTKVIITPNIPR
jgi:hypothetical protein